MLLAVLLVDATVFGRGVEYAKTHNGMLDRGVLTRSLQGIEELYQWAETDW